MAVLEPRRLMLKLNTALVNELHELQVEIVLIQELRKEFGNNALPISKYTRPYIRTMDDIEERESGLESRRARARDLVDTINEIGALVKKAEQEDDEAWAVAMAEFLKQRRRQEAPPAKKPAKA